MGIVLPLGGVVSQLSPRRTVSDPPSGGHRLGRKRPNVGNRFKQLRGHVRFPDSVKDGFAFVDAIRQLAVLVQELARLHVDSSEHRLAA